MAVTPYGSLQGFVVTNCHQMPSARLALIEVSRVLAEGSVSKYVLMKKIAAMTYFATSGSLMQNELSQALDAYKRARQENPSEDLSDVQANERMQGYREILVSDKYKKGWSERKQEEPLWNQFLEPYTKSLQEIISF